MYKSSLQMGDHESTDPYQQLLNVPGAALEMDAEDPHLLLCVDPGIEQEVTEKVYRLTKAWTDGADADSISVTETSQRHLTAKKIRTPLGSITTAYATIGAGEPELVSVIVRPGVVANR